jgi:hypothetical protein
VEHLLIALVQLVTLVAVVVSLVIPLYCVPTALVAFFRRTPYSPWPPLLLALLWLAQWPLCFFLVFSLPNAPAISGDSHDSLGMDSAMLLGFILFNAGPCYWVYRHRARFVHDE